MMEKRNVATARRSVDDDDEDLAREASLFGPSEKRASRVSGSVSGASRADEDGDEDTGTGDMRARA